MIEIERKFLVLSTTFKSFSRKETLLSQGFLSTDPLRTVRIRTSNKQAWITIKGMGSQDGTTRFEWENEISLVEARALLALCKPSLIEKTRYEVPVGKHLFEVDVFHGENLGLIVAEIELSSANEDFKKPDWLGIEVTGEKAYYNASLSEFPFSAW